MAWRRGYITLAVLGRRRHFTELSANSALHAHKVLQASTLAVAGY